MDKFYRKKELNFTNKKDIDFQIIEWWCQDEYNPEEEDETENEEEDSKNKDTYTIRCFGVTSTGDSITCKITGFNPFYYIKVPDDFTRLNLINLLQYIENYLQHVKNNAYHSPLAKENGQYKSRIVEKKDLYGFQNGKTYRFVQLVFNNYAALMRSRYLFKNAIKINNVNKSEYKYKLYESNFEPFMRYCHIKDILMAGWVKLPAGKYNKTESEANTQLEVSIDRKNIISLRDKKEIARFLQASWDIETYSYDGTFPDPKKKVIDKNTGQITYPNVIYQIATTYKYYGDNTTTIKHLLTLKKCAKIDDPNVIVEECETEKELIKKWIDTIYKMDPDVLYTYNGDSFDCMYITERALINNLLKTAIADNYIKKESKTGYLFQKFSRLKFTQAEIKKEFFSSSAYGDSEFNRVYIPGRLNYDLLIHFKRGMKKYASYKLDYIANEILKEGKHDISAKEIFGHYEKGTPELIREIAEYCIVDTELLQKLVDKQLILITIIQLANVTYVPIGFLTTRGQTIKVYSQILRKARQMDFLVPHTNFNEDSYSLEIKTKDPHSFIQEEIEREDHYIEINCGNSQQEGSKTKKLVFKAKISEVIDENHFIALCGIELTKEFFNVKYKYKYSEHLITRLVPNDDPVDDSFTGATVLTASSGLHTDNIAILDYASLYPTIIISRNLCYSTFIMDKQYDNLTGVDYELQEWNDRVEYKLRQTCEGVGKSGKSKGLVCGKQAFFDVDGKFYCRIHDPIKKTRSSEEKFQKKDVHYSYKIVLPTKKEDGTIINKGVLPALLEELYAERKNVKRQMAKAEEDGNKLLADILNHTQLAIKISLDIRGQ